MSVLRIIETNPPGHSLCLFWSDWRKVWSLLAQLCGGEGAPSLFPVPAERGQGLPHPLLRKWHRPSASHSRTNTRNVQTDLSQLFLIYSYQQKNGVTLGSPLDCKSGFPIIIAQSSLRFKQQSEEFLLWLLYSSVSTTC